MVATAEKGPRKTDFVADYLGRNPTANHAEVKAAWSEAGHADSISQTLVSNLRAKLKLTGNTRGGRKPGSGRSKAANGPAAGVKRGPGRPRLDANGSHAAPAPAAEKKARRGDREALLAEIEGEFDRLIYKLIAVGGLAHVEDALRAARRVVVRSHGG